MIQGKVEWPTLGVLALTYLVWGGATLLWSHSGVLAIVLTGLAIAQHSSLQHEALHGHPFRRAWVNEALVFPALSLFIPYRRFRDTHLLHHHDPHLTDPYDDPESCYVDPADWARTGPVWRWIRGVNNTLAGRMVLGPLLGTPRFVGADLVAMLRGDRDVIVAWALHLVGLGLLLAWLLLGTAMPLWAYVLAVWLGFGLLRIRTFLEHRAHDIARARTVVIEDRGPLSILFLNNNYHAVHHMHPKVAWYELPALYASRRAHYLRRNGDYVYRNYGEIFRQYFLRAKDPVAHPIWPVPKSDMPEGEPVNDA